MDSTPFRGRARGGEGAEGSCEAVVSEAVAAGGWAGGWVVAEHAKEGVCWWVGVQAGWRQ